MLQSEHRKTIPQGPRGVQRSPLPTTGSVGARPRGCWLWARTPSRPRVTDATWSRVWGTWATFSPPWAPGGCLLLPAAEEPLQTGNPRPRDPLQEVSVGLGTMPRQACHSGPHGSTGLSQVECPHRALVEWGSHPARRSRWTSRRWTQARGTNRSAGQKHFGATWWPWATSLAQTQLRPPGHSRRFGCGEDS